MTKETSIKWFNDRQIRTHWDEEQEKWYFSIVDVVGVLTDSPAPNNYWKVLKHRLVKEGSQLVTNCNQLKMLSADGKFYKTDVADTEQLFRLIQSIPSPKAEPFKMWLAQVGREERAGVCHSYRWNHESLERLYHQPIQRVESVEKGEPLRPVSILLTKEEPLQETPEGKLKKKQEKRLWQLRMRNNSKKRRAKRLKNRNGNKIGLYLVFSKIHNLPTTGLRFFTVYGPWGRPDMSPMLFADAIMNGNTLKVFNNGDMGRDLKKQFLARKAARLHWNAGRLPG